MPLETWLESSLEFRGEGVRRESSLGRVGGGESTSGPESRFHVVGDWGRIRGDSST